MGSKLCTLLHIFLCSHFSPQGHQGSRVLSPANQKLVSPHLAHSEFMKSPSTRNVPMFDIYSCLFDVARKNTLRSIFNLKTLLFCLRTVQKQVDLFALFCYYLHFVQGWQKCYNFAMENVKIKSNYHPKESCMLFLVCNKKEKVELNIEFILKIF